MVAFDPEKLRALATDTRTHRDAIGKLNPIGEHNRDAALDAMRSPPSRKTSETC